MPLARRPDPPPLETDDVTIVLVGSLLWAVALGVLLVLAATGTEIRTWWLVMCGYGAGLGLLGVGLCARRRAHLPSRNG